MNWMNMAIDFANLNPSQWFQEQLRASGYGFIWAVKQVPAERQNELPPQQLGEWAASRHVFHLLYHEENIALPRIKQWLGGESPLVDRNAEEMTRNSGENVESMLEKFLNLRLEQVKLASQFTGEMWNQRKDVQGWGPVSLHWVFSKNYQHTAEHIHDVLRLALFWDRSLKQMKM
jgi:hypothetical protein